jgi:hypothetical protein
MAGDGLVLVSLLLSATVTVAQARLLTGRDPVAVTAVQFLGATLGSLPVAALTEGAPAAPASAGVVLAVVALALAGTLVPFTLFAFGQSRVSAEVAGAFLNLEPLVGAVAGVVAFGDPAGLAQIAGGMAILAGIALSSLPLLAGRRMARRTAAAVTASAEAGARTGRVDAGIAARRAGAEARFSKGESVPNRFGRAPHSLSAGAGHSGRSGVFVVVRGGKFGAGRPGGTRPGVAGPERTRPGGRAAGRPPARGRGPGRGTDGPPPGGSGRRPGESGRRPGEPTQRPGRQRTGRQGTGRRGTGRQRTGRRGPTGPRRTLGGVRPGLPQVQA